MPGFTLWFTGLPSAGKSTLSLAVVESLRAHGVPTELFDGDEVRRHLSTKLGFSKEDRDINVLRIGYVCNLLARHGVAAVAALISPYRDARDQLRSAADAPFIEVHVDCPFEVCAQRDVKGLYAKAKRGEITGFTGVDDPYEPPENPEITCPTHAESVAQCTQRVMDRLVELGLIDARTEPGA